MQKHFSISLDVYATAQKERPFSGNHFPRTAFPRFYVSAVYDYSTSENSSFPTPQSGQRKSSPLPTDSNKTLPFITFDKATGTQS